MISPRTLLIRATVISAAVLCVFLLLSVIIQTKATRAFENARKAEEEGRVEIAVVHYTDAIRNHSIFGSHGRQARQRLLEIADEFDEQGRTRRATAVRQELLSALAAVETGFSGNRALMDDLEALVLEGLSAPPERRKAPSASDDQSSTATLTRPRR